MTNLWVFPTSLDFEFLIGASFRGAVLNRTFSKVCVENLGFCSQRWLWYWKYTSIWMAMLLFHTNSQHSLCLEENVGWDFLFCLFFVFGWLKFFERMAFQVFVLQSLKWLASRWKRTAKRGTTILHLQFFVTTPGTHKQTACAPITGDLSNWRLDKFRLECPELTALTAYRFWKLRRKQLPRLGWWWIFRWTESGESFPLLFFGKGLMMGLCKDIYISSAFFFWIFTNHQQELLNGTWFFLGMPSMTVLVIIGLEGTKTATVGISISSHFHNFLSS